MAVGRGKQRRTVEQEFQPAQHRSAGDRSQGSDRECQMARGLAAWRVDQPHRRVRYQESRVDTGVAQKALEPLVRCGFPAVEGAARIRIDTRSLDANEELPPLPAVAELGDGPCRLERGGVLR